MSLSVLENGRSSNEICGTSHSQSNSRLIIESDTSECHHGYSSNSSVVKLIPSIIDFDRSENVINILKSDSVLKNIVHDFLKIYNTCCATVLIDETFSK